MQRAPPPSAACPPQRSGDGDLGLLMRFPRGTNDAERRAVSCTPLPGRRKGRGQALGLRLTFVRLLQQLFQVGRHKIRLFGRAIVTLQVFHCKEKPPPAPRSDRGAGGGQTRRLAVAGGRARGPKAERCWRSRRPARLIIIFDRNKSLLAHPGPGGWFSLCLS